MAVRDCLYDSRRQVAGDALLEDKERLDSTAAAVGRGSEHTELGGIFHVSEEFWREGTAHACFLSFIATSTHRFWMGHALPSPDPTSLPTHGTPPSVCVMVPFTPMRNCCFDLCFLSFFESFEVAETDADSFRSHSSSSISPCLLFCSCRVVLAVVVGLCDRARNPLLP